MPSSRSPILTGMFEVDDLLRSPDGVAAVLGRRKIGAPDGRRGLDGDELKLGRS